jgi:hypothetical protein
MSWEDQTDCCFFALAICSSVSYTTDTLLINQILRAPKATLAACLRLRKVMYGFIMAIVDVLFQRGKSQEALV